MKKKFVMKTNLNFYKTIIVDITKIYEDYSVKSYMLIVFFIYK